jgi:hypothetical protein
MRVSPIWIAPFCLVAACSSPDLTAEVGTFAEAVRGVSGEYRSALAIDSGTVRRGQVDALVADRKQVVQLSTACDQLGTNDPAVSVSDCVLDDSTVVLPENSMARAEMQLLLLADYFAALDTLVKSKGPTDIQNATAAALSAVGKLDAALPKPGLGAFAQTLQDRRAGITKAAGLLAEQYKYGQLRKVVAEADPAVSRIVLALKDAAVAAGVEPPAAAYDRLVEKQNAMDDASRGDPAVYRAAVDAFYAEYDAFVAYRKSGLIPRLDLIKATHAALRQRLSGPASLTDVATLIDRLNTLKSDSE